MIRSLAQLDRRHGWLLPLAGLLGGLSLALAILWPDPPERTSVRVTPARAARSRFHQPLPPAPQGQVRARAMARPRPLSAAELLGRVPAARLREATAGIERALARNPKDWKEEELAAALARPSAPVAAAALLADPALSAQREERLVRACRKLDGTRRLELVEAFFTLAPARAERPSPARARQVRWLLDRIPGKRPERLLHRILASPAAVALLGSVYDVVTGAESTYASTAGELDRLLESGQVPFARALDHLSTRASLDPAGALPQLMQALEHPNPAVRRYARLIILHRNEPSYKAGWLALYPTATSEEQVMLACKLADQGHRPAWRAIKAWLDRGDWPKARECIAFLAGYSGGGYMDPLLLPPDLRWPLVRHWSAWVERHLASPASGKPRPVGRW